MSTREDARLDALVRLNLLDTPPSETFDRITRTASQLFGLPIAAVSLTDSTRQWFKSRVGVDHDSIPRHKAPCAEVTDSSELLVISDLRANQCYSTSLLASQGIRFYAGAPLITREGHVLGALCVLGTEPRVITVGEAAALKDMALMVMAQIELQHAFGRLDPISKLPNRTQFLDDLEDMCRDQPGSRRLAVMVDIARPDQLRNGTQILGVDYIDSVVLEAAGHIGLLLGLNGSAYHVGSTQLAFLMPTAYDESTFIDALRALAMKLAAGSSQGFVAVAAIGIAPFTMGQDSPASILRMARSAALDACASESAVMIYSPERNSVLERRFRLMNDFSAALEADDQLSLVFQPRLILESGACAGAEALLRWRHPELGDVAPGEFIPIIEQTSLANRLTAWVLDRALSQISLWHAAGRRLSLSVNISATNLNAADFTQQVQLRLLRHRVRAEYLELELTESAVMQNAGMALEHLTALKKAGIRLAIDDFGTGYSSLSYLQKLPVHVVKIDRAFISELTNGEKEASLVKSMITLCHDLGFKVVAEGVERINEDEILRELACDEVQGYFYGRPMNVRDLEGWLAKNALPQALAS